MAKCAALWNKSSRSTIAAELVHSKCGLALIVPNATRWNSTFDAVARLNAIHTKSDTVLNELRDGLKLPVSRPSELSFIAEYVAVMQLLANAFDILQGEQKCYTVISVCYCQQS